MIIPNVRGAFGRAEATLVIGVLTRGDTAAREREEERLRREGFDALLDDPRTLNALLAGPGLSTVPAPLLFYLLVRHALLEDGLADRTTADYLAALLLEYGRRNRAWVVEEGDGVELRYLTEIVAGVDAPGRRGFLLRAHLGEFALWMSGLYPDWVEWRRGRRGAPGLSYYEELGARGYRLAAQTSDAESWGLDTLYRGCAEAFPRLRVALNRLSDRYLTPRGGDPVDRLLRQVADDFGTRPIGN